MKDKVKQLDFKGMHLSWYRHVHKKSWWVDICSKEFDLENYSQDTDAKILLRHLQKSYPEAGYRIAYEVR